MRRFRTSTGESGSSYGLGVLSGIIVTLLVLAAVRAVEWAMANPVVEVIHTWATTPQITPVGLLTGILLLFIVWSAWMMMQL